MVFLVLAATALTLFLAYLWHISGHWARRKVPSPCPSEYLGILWNNISMSEHIGIVTDKMYKRFHGKPYYGTFSFFKPLFVVKDLELVKMVLQTDFNSFQKK
uniref:Putative secreted protein n=1 Tax=Xenopsylla cheopis TaxID=163159 RepID=A0A6M2DZN5_XENCH